MQAAATATTALATHVVVRPTFVYEALDPGTKIPFYVGRTGDLDRRARQHQKRCMKKIRELMKLKDFKFRDVQRRVPELPDGCAPTDAHEMEAYFIFERKVVYDPVTCPLGCNSRIGDHGTEMTPARFAELEQMFAGEGYHFPVVDEPKVVRDARGEYEIATALAGMAEQVGDKECVKGLNECRVLAKKELLEIERAHLGLRAFVERVLADYDHVYVDAVDQGTLQVGLNMIKEKMDEDEAFKDLTRIITSISLVCKEKKGVDVSSEAAASFLKGVLAMIGSREEATLLWSHKGVEAWLKALRVWTKSRGMQKPLRGSGDKEERSLGNFLIHWKRDNVHFGGECTDLLNCRVVMRGVAWFEEFLGVADKNANNLIELNTQLRDGFAWNDEPDFDGKKAMNACNTNQQIYQKLRSLVRGIGKPTDVATALKGLPANRAAHYQGLYDTNRVDALKKKISDKRKREVAASISTTSTDAPGEEDEEDEQNEEDEEELDLLPSEDEQ